MRLCLVIALLELASCLSPVFAAERTPDSVVRKLYKEVVARNPLGIPKGADKAAIWPFLSKGLIRHLETGQACQDDYFRQHASKDGKPEFGWLESGLFSGENEQATPAAAAVERVDRQKDGSFHVRVRLTYRDPTDTRAEAWRAATIYHWHVVAVVIAENGRFVIDDVLLFKDDSTRSESHLADSFRGCDGPRWVGDKSN